MPADYSIYVLGESQISISGGGQLDGVTQGNGRYLGRLTITRSSGTWASVEITDECADFQDQDIGQRLFGTQTIGSVQSAANTVAEAKFGIAVGDGISSCRWSGSTSIQQALRRAL